MFELQVEIQTLDELLTSIELLSDEVRFVFSPDQLSIPVVHESNVAKADIDMSSDAFQSYDCGSITIGVPIEKIRKIVDLSRDGAVADAEIFPQKQKIHMDVDGQEYNIALVDPQYVPEGVETPEMARPAKIKMEAETFSRSVASADAFADHISFRASTEEENFVMIAKGDLDDTRNELSEEDLIELESADISTKFSLAYLSELADAIPDTSDVSIKLGDDVPAIIEYSLSEGDGDVEYVISPRLENN